MAARAAQIRRRREDISFTSSRELGATLALLDQGTFGMPPLRAAKAMAARAAQIRRRREDIPVTSFQELGRADASWLGHVRDAAVEGGEGDGGEGRADQAKARSHSGSPPLNRVGSAICHKSTSPDGTLVDVPADRVQDAIGMGG